MNKTRNFLTVLIVLLMIGVFGCADDPDGGNGIGSGSGSSGGGVSLTPPVEGVQPAPPTPAPTPAIDVSKFFGYEWGVASSWNGSDYDFKWIFEPNGTISVIHCCGELFEKQFSYLFKGNVFVTYGSEMDVDKLEVTTFEVTDNGTILKLNNKEKTTYKRGNARTSSGSVLKLTNDLIGTWKGSDGKSYVFGSDASLKIGSDQYGYLVRNAHIVTLGSDGKATDYTFTLNKTTGVLTLKGSTTITLTK